MREQVGISKGIDWITIWLYIIFVSIGLLCIYSVEQRSGESIFQNFTGLKKNYSRQLLFIGICAVIAVLILLTESKFFTATANIGYAFGIILMMLTFVAGKNINGSKSWIPLGFFNLQPVETCKIFTALALSKFLSLTETNFQKTRSQVIAAVLILVPVGFSLMQNETGLALVYFSFLIPMYREGLPPVYLIVGFALAVLIVATILVEKNTLAIVITAIAVLAVYFMRKAIKKNKAILLSIIGLWILCVSIQRFAVPYIFTKILQPYQVERIMNTFGVDYVPGDNATAKKLDEQKVKEEQKTKKIKKEKENYNVKQSKIAIGSGGFWGEGFFKRHTNTR